MYEPLPPIFDGLSDEDRQTALQRFKVVPVGADVRLIVEGDVDPTLVVLQSGELVVSNGHTILGKVRAGEIVGEMALFAEGPRRATVTSAVPSSLLVLDRASYDTLRRARHPVAYALEDRALLQLAERLRRTRARISDLAKGTPVDRATAHPGFLARVKAVFGEGDVFPAGRIDGPAVLASSPLFADAPDEILEEVAACFTGVGSRRGRFLCSEGEPGNEMFVIASGTVDVLVATSEDRVQPVATLGAGDAFGVCSLVQLEQVRMASCVARDDVRALSMDKLQWARTGTRGDLVGSVLRVALIRALAAQLGYANAQIARLSEEKNLELLVKAGVGVEAHGRFLVSEEDLPSYLRGVDHPW